MSENEQTRYTLRLDTELHKRYMSVAKSNDENPSQLIRQFMRDYIKKNAQADLFKK